MQVADVADLALDLVAEVWLGFLLVGSRHLRHCHVNGDELEAERRSFLFANGGSEIAALRLLRLVGGSLGWLLRAAAEA